MSARSPSRRAPRGVSSRSPSRRWTTPARSSSSSMRLSVRRSRTASSPRLRRSASSSTSSRLAPAYSPPSASSSSSSSDSVCIWSTSPPSPAGPSPSAPSRTRSQSRWGAASRRCSDSCAELELQVEVAEGRLGEAAELVPLLRRHRGEHLRHRGRPAREHLEHLVQGPRALREQVPVLGEERLDVGLLAAGPLLEQLVQVGEHAGDRGDVLGRHRLERPGEVAQVGVEEVAAELVEQRLEPLGGLGGREVVVAEGPQPTSRVGGEGVEVELAPAGVLVVAPGELGPLEVDHRLELGGHTIERARQVGALPEPLALLTHLVPEAVEAAASTEPVAQQALERGPAARTVQEVALETPEDLTDVEVLAERVLGAVVAAVAVHLADGRAHPARTCRSPPTRAGSGGVTCRRVRRSAGAGPRHRRWRRGRGAPARHRWSAGSGRRPGPPARPRAGRRPRRSPSRRRGRCHPRGPSGG